MNAQIRWWRSGFNGCLNWGFNPLSSNPPLPTLINHPNQPTKPSFTKPTNQSTLTNPFSSTHPHQPTFTNPPSPIHLHQPTPHQDFIGRFFNGLNDEHISTQHHAGLSSRHVLAVTLLLLQRLFRSHLRQLQQIPFARFDACVAENFEVLLGVLIQYNTIQKRILL